MKVRLLPVIGMCMCMCMCLMCVLWIHKYRNRTTGGKETFVQDLLDLISKFAQETSVYCSGSNDYYQCVYDKNEYKKFEDITLIDPNVIKEFKDIMVVQVAAGAIHSVFLTNRGVVYCCGSCTAGQSGRPSKYGGVKLATIPYFTQGLSHKTHIKISQIACGSAYTLCLDSRGNLYTFGDLSDGTVDYNSYRKRLEGEEALDKDREPQLRKAYYKKAAGERKKVIKLKSINANNTLVQYVDVEGKIFIWGKSYIDTQVAGPNGSYDSQQFGWADSPENVKLGDRRRSKMGDNGGNDSDSDEGENRFEGYIFTDIDAKKSEAKGKVLDCLNCGTFCVLRTQV